MWDMPVVRMARGNWGKVDGWRCGRCPNMPRNVPIRGRGGWGAGFVMFLGDLGAGVAGLVVLVRARVEHQTRMRHIEHLPNFRLVCKDIFGGFFRLSLILKTIKFSLGSKLPRLLLGAIVFHEYRLNRLLR